MPSVFIIKFRCGVNKENLTIAVKSGRIIYSLCKSVKIHKQIHNKDQNITRALSLYLKTFSAWRLYART